MLTIQETQINYTALGVILDGLLNRLGEPDEIIDRDGNEYLHRWYIVRNYGEYNVYLHKFLRDDVDDALHDHPWPSASIILSGQYLEIMEDGEHVRKTGEVIFRDAETAHRIVLTDGHVYTLFITGKKVRPWGFHCEDGWKYWEDFERDGGC